MQEKRFLQQNWLLSPASCGKAETGEARGQSGSLLPGLFPSPWASAQPLLLWSEDPHPKGSCRQETPTSPMHYSNARAAKHGDA